MKPLFLAFLTTIIILSCKKENNTENREQPVITAKMNGKTFVAPSLRNAWGGWDWEVIDVYGRSGDTLLSISVARKGDITVGSYTGATYWEMYNELGAFSCSTIGVNIGNDYFETFHDSSGICRTGVNITQREFDLLRGSFFGSVEITSGLDSGKRINLEGNFLFKK